MTELTRRVLDAFSGRTNQGFEQPLPAAPVAQLRVDLRLPKEILDDCGPELLDSLHQHLAALLGELSIQRQLILTHSAAPGAIAEAALSIDDRPAALLPCDGPVAGGTEGEALSRRIIDLALRRLPLLLGTDVDDSGVASYLVALGCAMPEQVRAAEATVETAEQLIDERSNEEIVLEVAPAILRRVDGAADQALVTFRETEYRKRGVLYPDVRIELTDREPGAVRLRLNDVTLPSRQLGDAAGWAEVISYLQAELTARREWFVRTRDVSRMLDDELAYLFPDLVAVALANYPRAVVTACLRELVRGGRRMRNLPRILWLLLEQGGSHAGSDVLKLSESPLLPKSRYRPVAERDPIVLAARVRKMGAEETWRLGNYHPPRNAIRLTAGLEDRLLTQGDPQARAAAEWAAVRAVAAVSGAERVITRTIEAIGPVRDALQAIERPLRIMASHELPPDSDLAAIPVATEPLVRA